VSEYAKKSGKKLQHKVQQQKPFTEASALHVKRDCHKPVDHK